MAKTFNTEYREKLFTSFGGINRRGAPGDITDSDNVGTDERGALYSFSGYDRFLLDCEIISATVFSGKAVTVVKNGNGARVYINGELLCDHDGVPVSLSGERKSFAPLGKTLSIFPDGIALIFPENECDLAVGKSEDGEGLFEKLVCDFDTASEIYTVTLSAPDGAFPQNADPFSGLADGDEINIVNSESGERVFLTVARQYESRAFLSGKLITLYHIEARDSDTAPLFEGQSVGEAISGHFFIFRPRGKIATENYRAHFRFDSFTFQPVFDKSGENHLFDRLTVSAHSRFTEIKDANFHPGDVILVRKLGIVQNSSGEKVDAGVNNKDYTLLRFERRLVDTPYGAACRLTLDFAPQSFALYLTSTLDLSGTDCGGGFLFRKNVIPDIVFTHADRIFGAMGAKVFCSARLSPFSLGGGGDDTFETSSGEGDVTGGISFSFPTFFKKDAVCLLLGDRPENYFLSTIPAPGTARDYMSTAAVCDRYLIYCAPRGIFSFDGERVDKISSTLISPSGSEKESPATVPDMRAASDGRRYFVTLDEGKKSSLFIYDTESACWQRNGDITDIAFSVFDRSLFLGTKTDVGFFLYSLGTPEETGDYIEKIGDFIVAYEKTQNCCSVTLSLVDGYMMRNTVNRISLCITHQNEISLTVIADDKVIEAREYAPRQSENIITVPVSPRHSVTGLKISGKGDWLLRTVWVRYTVGSDL